MEYWTAADYPLLRQKDTVHDTAIKLDRLALSFRRQIPAAPGIIQPKPGGSSIMNAENLRSIQAPLKEHYRQSPESAQITLSAQGRISEGVSCKIETGKSLVNAGLHPATGGDGLAACSGDMLLEALVACAGVTLNAVATALDIELRDASLLAEGDLDFRGTLGVAKEVPVGFQSIRLQFTLDTDASEEQLATLLRLTQRYCVVYQTLAHPPILAVTRKLAAT